MLAAADITSDLADFIGAQDVLYVGGGNTAHQLVRAGLPAGYAAEDDTALHFTGATLSEVVSDRPGGTAYRVDREGEEVVETRLPARLLTATF